MLTPGANTAWPSLSFRNDTPRATAGPEIAPTKGPISELAWRFSKITAALRLSILRAPMRATARRAASAPIDSGEGRSASWRVERPSPPRSMPLPSPAMAEAESEKLEALTPPSKPPLVTRAQPPWLQPAEAPSVLVTPGV